MNANERLLAIIRALSRSKSDFARQMGISTQALNSWLNYDPVSEKTARRICTVFPQVNKYWLLDGIGEMLNAPISAEMPQNSTLQQNPNNYPDTLIVELRNEIKALKEDKRLLSETIRKMSIVIEQLTTNTNEQKKSIAN